uniref:Uncharacterized protein n=1 Tax=Rhizophora mucronata TaxID=61149 RepID=A0A2P2N7H5_RHIMU
MSTSLSLLHTLWFSFKSSWLVLVLDPCESCIADHFLSENGIFR